jgi:peroxiredoxin Q/BCP
MNKPDSGDTAPHFTLPVDGGSEFTLSASNESKIVIFFYPKDDTSGCTAEAIDFTSAKEQFAKLDVRIFGMSPDPIKKHDKFKLKHEIDVSLISDEEKTVLGAYGVWVEKSMYGRKYMGVERSTFLIGKDGKIIQAWRKVKVPGHVDAVLEAAMSS